MRRRNSNDVSRYDPMTNSNANGCHDPAPVINTNDNIVVPHYDSSPHFLHHRQKFTATTSTNNHNSNNSRQLHANHRLFIRQRRQMTILSSSAATNYQLPIYRLWQYLPSLPSPPPSSASFYNLMCGCLSSSRQQQQPHQPQHSLPPFRHQQQKHHRHKRRRKQRLIISKTLLLLLFILCLCVMTVEDESSSSSPSSSSSYMRLFWILWDISLRSTVNRIYGWYQYLSPPTVVVGDAAAVVAGVPVVPTVLAETTPTDDDDDDDDEPKVNHDGTTPIPTTVSTSSLSSLIPLVNGLSLPSRAGGCGDTDHRMIPRVISRALTPPATTNTTSTSTKKHSKRIHRVLIDTIPSSSLKEMNNDGQALVYRAIYHFVRERLILSARRDAAFGQHHQQRRMIRGGHHHHHDNLSPPSSSPHDKAKNNDDDHWEIHVIVSLPSSSSSNPYGYTTTKRDLDDILAELSPVLTLTSSQQQSLDVVSVVVVTVKLHVLLPLPSVINDENEDTLFAVRESWTALEDYYENNSMRNDNGAGGLIGSIGLRQSSSSSSSLLPFLQLLWDRCRISPQLYHLPLSSFIMTTNNNNNDDMIHWMKQKSDSLTMVINGLTDATTTMTTTEESSSRLKRFITALCHIHQISESDCPSSSSSAMMTFLELWLTMTKGVITSLPLTIDDTSKNETTTTTTVNVISKKLISSLSPRLNQNMERIIHSSLAKTTTTTTKLMLPDDDDWMMK